MASPAPTLVPNIGRPLSPTQLEQLALEYRDLETKIDEIEKRATEEVTPLRARLDELWELLVGHVRRFGSQHAAKSKLLHGLTLEVMGTFGSSSSIDGAAVETFRLALVKAKQSRVLKKIFEQTIRWTLLPQAGAFLRAEHDKGKFPAKLFVLFARCSVSKESTPRLEVRPKASS